jgi:RNA polymerase sigma factor (sigma-70 family)
MVTHDGQDNQALTEHCLQIALQLIARNGWRLLAAEELAARTAVELCSRQDLAGEQLPERLMTAIYVEALHRACSRAEGEMRREIGYGELSDYLRGVARVKYPDVAEDAASMALLATMEKFGDCRNPRAFLLFALQRLWTGVRRLRRQEQPWALSLDQPLHDDSDSPLSERIEEGDASPLEQTTAHELRDEVGRAAEAFRRAHPRARDQFAALYLKYINELSDGEIALALGTNIANVHVLRSRAKQKLREDPAWQALAVEAEAGPIGPAAGAQDDAAPTAR